MSTSYNPQTGLYYVMTLESCGVYSKSSARWERGKSFYGGGTRRALGDINQKDLRGIDIPMGKIVWEYPQIGPGASWGGLLSTGGGIVFFCDDSGAFAAVDAKSGTPLWHFNASQSWHASPMTYAVEGTQYVGVADRSNILAFVLA
ncbi:MAG: PQQ-binding-like beta-propeller repeat protein [Acidobacteriota bacterium]|nr:PQQ-binding-like beta-propeller repeat protein [Acidobacteriota bacterium]